MEKKQLGFIAVAFMYVGTIMGAGFASGREAWQFFGLFGDRGFIGVSIAGICFMLLGMMVSYIAQAKQTSDMGKIILFIDNDHASNVIGNMMAAILYTIIISMSAAGGAFLSQMFHVHRAIGGGIIVLLVIITVLGDFERISQVFKKVVPILFVVVVSCSILVICSSIQQSGQTSGFKPSSIAQNWFVAAFLFTSYNMMGMIPIVAKSSLQAKTAKEGIIGSCLGGLMLLIITFVLILALQKDMAYSMNLDLPMLGYAGRISPVAKWIFAAILFAAIYAAATSTYYGFSTKIPNKSWKKYVLIIGAVVGFILGLSGFKVIVAYLYPIEGYVGFIILISIVINFIKTWITVTNKKR